MTNESNNKNFKSELTDELKKKIKKSVADSFEKKGGYKVYNEELKKDEEKNRTDYLRKMNDVSSPSNRFDVRPNSPEALRHGLASDRARIQGSVARQAEAQRMKIEATKKIKKKLDKDIQKSPKMKGVKGKIAAKVASKVLGNAAYALTQKMTAEMNKGGPGAILVILFTLILALLTDAIDILGELGVTALIVSVLGSILGAIAGGLLWIFNFLCALIIMMFWMFILGGGHKKYFWKRIIRTVIGLLVVESIPYLDLLPFATLMVCWNWYDFAKDKKKAKDDLEAFEKDFKKSKRIKQEYVEGYV